MATLKKMLKRCAKEDLKVVVDKDDYVCIVISSGDDGTRYYDWLKIEQGQEMPKRSCFMSTYKGEFNLDRNEIKQRGAKTRKAKKVLRQLTDESK